MLTCLPATPAAPEPWGISRRALLTPAPGSCLHTSHPQPPLQGGHRGTPRTPLETHISFSPSWNMCACPGWWSHHQPSVPGKGQLCRAAGLCPSCLVGFSYMLNEETQPDSGEGFLEWRRIMHTHMLVVNMPMCMHSHSTKILITRADTSFLSKELFHAIIKMMVQEKQLFLAWDSLLQ